MIHSALEPKFWESSERLNAACELDPTGEFTQLAYQATLDSDATPFDWFMEGEEQEGMRLFQNAAECTRADSFERTGVRPAGDDIGSGNGAIKSIGLRNVEFTGPYFHNGGQSTLEQVVDFYRRGRKRRLWRF